MFKIMCDTVVNDDVQNIINVDSVDWKQFHGKTIAVTGATGLIGKMCVFALLAADKKYNLNLKVLAFVRNEKKAKAIFAGEANDQLAFVVTDILEPVPQNIIADYLIHGASVTASRMMVEQPVETIMTAIQGTRNMLQFAERCKMESMVYLSSMEVYGIMPKEQVEVKETDLGYINPLEIRSSYSEGKRMSECLCAAFASEYNVNVKIARLAQTFGAGIAKDENRVFAQFARSVIEKKDIVLHTRGEKANCYCYISDAIAGILTLLTHGNKGEAYNVANMDTFCSIREMAEIFVSVSENSTSKLVFDIPEDSNKYGYAPSSVLRLNSDKISTLGWKPLMNMNDMAKRLMQSMAQNEVE